MGHKDGTRFINLLFNSRDKTIEIRDENTQMVRSIDLSKGQPFDLWLSSNGYVAAIKLPKEYDLVCVKINNFNKLIGNRRLFTGDQVRG